MPAVDDYLILPSVPSAVWERYLEAPRTVPVPGALRRCWDRVRRLGAPPRGLAQEAVLSLPALRERQDRIDDVIALMPELLDPVVKAFDDQDHLLVLADRDGVVVHTAGGGDFAPTAEEVRLIAGSTWNESLRGTNAIGTVLAEGRPVSVRGSAHFARPNHALSCHASPIRDARGEVVAVLDATSSVHAASGFVSLAVLSLARSFERAMQERALREVGAAERALTGPILARFPGPALLVQPNGRVRYANDAALRGLPGLAATGIAAPVAPVRGDARAVLGLTASELQAAGKVPSGDGRWTIDLEPIRDREGNLLLLAAFLEPRRLVSSRPASPSAADPFAPLLGSDPALEDLRKRARRLARSNLPVLLLAETGTGKGALARCLHAASPRSSGPLVAINCGAVHGQLLESELFGYAPGAFTGASPKGGTGQLAAADGGTLFLDEVADMPPALQVALLRFLDDGSYRRVGEAKQRTADVRILCATCQDLPALVESGAFRADLYYRIQGAVLTLPPLRARSDVLELAEAFLAEATPSGEQTPMLTDAARDWLRAAPWPGNVRQLKSTLQYATVLTDDGLIDVEHVRPDSSTPAAPVVGQVVSRDEADAAALRRALDRADGNVSAAARTLGVARSTVYRMMKKHGLG